MNLKRINTVKAKLTISILLLTLVIVFFVGIYFPGRFKQEQLKALEDKANTTSSIIAANISSSIFFNDTDVLSEDLGRLIKYNVIGYIVVKANNNILYNYNLEAAQKNNFENPSDIKYIDEDVYFKTIEKVIIEKEEVGTLYIGFRLSELHQQLSEIKKNLLFITILILLFGVIFSFAIGGIAAILYESRFKVKHTKIKVKTYDRNIAFHTLSIVSPIIIFFPLYFLTDINPIYSTIVALFTGGILSMICRPDLSKSMFLGGMIFTVLYFSFFYLINLADPGFVGYWNITAISGILIIGVPLEELLFAFVFGLMWSSIYEHVFGYKLKTR